MDEKEKQLERSRKYKIGVKDGGHVTMPTEFAQRWPDITDEDFLDPVNYRYPCPNAEQTAVAARYWAQEDNQRQYSPDERKIIEQRLENFKKKFQIGEYKTANKRYIIALDFSEEPKEIQILPYGWVNSRKGNFLVDEQAMKEIINNFNSRANDMVIDYEHQTLEGTEAPAAGWIKELIDKGKEGLWAKVEWTRRAREYLKNKEYRYLSPVVIQRLSDKRIFDIHSAALTNTPAIDGMAPIVNKNDVMEEDKMDLKELKKKLGLAEDATEEDIIKAVEILANSNKYLKVFKDETLKAMELNADAKIEDIRAKVISLKNPSGYVSIQEFNQLKEKLQKKETAELVEMALKQGKVTPAQKEWAEKYAEKDPDGFKVFVEKAPVVVPLNKITDSKDSDKPIIDDTQMLVNKMLGISDDEFKKAYGGDK
ncbi:MAG: hypothetical protein PWQ97_454 [Tepidanaerobacteraceae bacterium]|nr:hypothetical protein [Tepidanaerobacteraceae bacterium]